LASVSTLLTTVGKPKQPGLHRERRLVARLAAIAFDRVEDRSLFATDVRAGAATDLDVEPNAATDDVVAEEIVGARLIDRMLQSLRGERILAANVDEAALAARRECRRSSSLRRSRTDRLP
jgi:hypothetical protein